MSRAGIAGTPIPRLPPRLSIGDTVGLIEPAGFIDEDQRLEQVKYLIRGMGLVPKIGAHVGSRYGYLAGTDDERAADVNAMYADPEVKAVFTMRGGWGCARILPLLDWDVIRANPKLLIGYSDITALHLAFARYAGFATIHGPNAANSWPRTSWESFWRLGFAGATPVLGAPDTEEEVPPNRQPMATLRGGKAKGRLLGGNLTVLTAMVGTKWLPDFDGAILFLEDVGEAEYRIDRMMSQLALSGILEELAGVVFGQCTNCATAEPDYAGFTVPQLLGQYLAPLGVPAFIGANIGHLRNQLSLPVGAMVELDADSGTLALLEPVTA